MYLFFFFAILKVSIYFVKCDDANHFEGDEVIRAFPKTDDDVKALTDLFDSYDFWTEPRKNSPTDIRVTSKNKGDLSKTLNKIKIKNEVLIKDVEKLFKVEQKKSVKTRKNGVLDWKEYESHNSIQTWIKMMALKHKDICEKIKIGQTYEKRDMFVLWIRKDDKTKRPSNYKKKALWLDGGIHAREWISPAIATWIINELLTNKTQYSDIFDNLDIYILPQVNPDGYEYTRSKDRLWRKTRSKNAGSPCYGVDPNRNFGYKWGGKGTSANTCSSIYKGLKPFSEVETNNMKEFIMKRKEADWKIYLACHSYRQMILTPWGYTYDLPEDYAELEKLGKEAAEALKKVHGTSYEVGSATVLLGPGAGGSDDWAKGSAGFKYVYTIETRDTGEHGFLLPKDQIIPACQEVFEAFLVFARAIAKQSSR